MPIPNSLPPAQSGVPPTRGPLDDLEVDTLLLTALTSLEVKEGGAEINLALLTAAEKKLLLFLLLRHFGVREAAIPC